MLPAIYGANRMSSRLDVDPIRLLFDPPAGHTSLWDVNVFNDRYEASIDLPGFSKEELSIELKQNLLTVTGKQTASSSGRSRKAITQRLTMPNDADTSAVTAELKNGVLQMKIPKRVEALPKRIEING